MTPHARSRHRILRAVTLASLALAAHAVSASAKDDADSLRGQPEGTARRLLLGQGYEPIPYDAGEGLQFWWNRSRDRCLEVHLDRRRVTHAEVRDEKKCRKVSKAAPAPYAREGDGGRAVRVSDLVGRSASAGAAGLDQRGFVPVEERRDGAATYRWFHHPDTRQCVMMELRGNRVIAIDPADPRRCR